MQSKETDDVVGLVHRVRKKFYAYKVLQVWNTTPPESWCAVQVCLAEYEEDERKEQAEDEELKTPSKSPKLPEVKKKKGVPPAMASLTAPQRIRDEIKNLCKLLHNIPAVKGMHLASDLSRLTGFICRERVSICACRHTEDP